MDRKLTTNLTLVLLATIALATVCTPVANARDEKLDYTPPAPTGRHRMMATRRVGTNHHGGASPSNDAPNCGEKAGGQRCKHDLCCSQWGYCGSTKEYCGEKCQPDYGSCGDDGGGSEPPSASAPQPCTCNAAAEYSVLDESSAVLDHDDDGGGYDTPNCGTDKGGGGTCRDRLCCSRFGFCGETDEYCGDGCQRGYGRCGGGGHTPPGGGHHHSPPPPRRHNPPGGGHHHSPPPRPPPHHRSPPPQASAPSPCTC